MELLTALEASAPAQWLRHGRWSYALVNAGHVTGIALLFGAIVPLDLRMLGLWRGVPVAVLARVLVPVAVTGLLLAVTMGAALFATRAVEYAANPAFLAKIGLVVLGAANAVVLHRSSAWRRPEAHARRLAVAGLSSLLLWLGAILAGRLIAFV